MQTAIQTHREFIGLPGLHSLGTGHALFKSITGWVDPSQAA